MFCTKCGKEIAEDSRFCTSCGCAIKPADTIPTIGSPTVVVPKRKIRTSWIVIGGVIVILIIAILVDRNSPENKAARIEHEKSEKTKVPEKPVSWGDVKKSWEEARRAKQDLDKSVNELKSEWNGLKKQVKDAVKGIENEGGATKVDQETTVKEFNSAVQKFKAVIENDLNDEDLQNAGKELKAALED